MDFESAEKNKVLFTDRDPHYYYYYYYYYCCKELCGTTNKTTLHVRKEERQ
jgi:hypothetical protein